MTPSQQCFLLGYRALCHELFRRRGALNIAHAAKALDTGMPLLGKVSVICGSNVLPEAFIKWLHG